ncbi:MAG: glycosyltransferase [Salinivirgaceae bacterium]|jgi:cellulose synthase/poly-beta-1,6-N-acetylglucosamine synthase-like glycosyltransferase|nr:glycosyltransferase [Salinivirgaceae bacterium]
MIYFILRILEKLFIVYFVLYLLIDVGLFLYSFVVFRRRQKPASTDYKWDQHPVSIIVPAYNEEVSIAYCADMLLRLDYPDYELIVVNDGSSDDTLEKLLKKFPLDLQQVKNDTPTLNTSKIRNVYRHRELKLTVIDKFNGGKADSLNAGINYATGRYVCTIDADSLLDNQALKSVVRPFIEDFRTMVSGGQLAASNDVILQNNQVISSRMPKNIWVLWQILEYIKSFMVSRMGLSKINALLLMSGAFSMFRRDELLKIGGFLSEQNRHPYIKKHIGTGKQTVCEDMEIVVRLFKYRYENNQKAKTRFIPGPVCWTEVPEKGKNLFKQRARWHQGLIESLRIHRAMIFEPRYGATGLLGMPYYLIFEMMAPLMKVLAIIFIIIAGLMDMLNLQWVVLMLIGILLLTAIITSGITAIVENWSLAQSETNRDALRYKTYKDWLTLILTRILGEFTYSFYKVIAQLNGFVNVIGKKSEWKKFERKGIEQ